MAKVHHLSRQDARRAHFFGRDFIELLLVDPELVFYQKAPPTEPNSTTTFAELGSRWSAYLAARCVTLPIWAISVAWPGTGS